MIVNWKHEARNAKSTHECLRETIALMRARPGVIGVDDEIAIEAAITAIQHWHNVCRSMSAKYTDADGHPILDSDELGPLLMRK